MLVCKHRVIKYKWVSRSSNGELLAEKDYQNHLKNFTPTTFTTPALHDSCKAHMGTLFSSWEFVNYAKHSPVTTSWNSIDLFVTLGTPELPCSSPTTPPALSFLGHASPPQPLQLQSLDPGVCFSTWCNLSGHIIYAPSQSSYHQGIALPHPVLHHGPDLQISTPSGLPNSLLNSSTWMIHRHQTDLILHTTHHPWYLHPSSYPNQLFQTPPPCQIQTPHPINFTSSVTWPLLNQIQALNNCYITWSHRFPTHLPMVTISIHYPLPLKLPSMLKLEVSADLISSFLHQDLQQFLTTEDQILASPPPLPVLPFKLFPAFLCSSFWMYQKYLWNVSSSS